MKKAAIIIGILLPISVFALEFRDRSLLYTDAPFLPAEKAGISLLTSIDAVSGYPDGAFRPNRSLNRAEFLKIALVSYPKVRVSSSDTDACFPDVRREDWFSPYVCLAKKRGIIKGYPDGEFKPGRSVNYAETLKILSELYDYVAYSTPEEEWYAGYVRAANFHKTALPIALKYDRAITRGQMARLAAAFRAKDEGQLETYRLAERSYDLVIAQERSSSSVSSIASTSFSSSSSSSSSSSFKAQSHFLVLGQSETIATGFFQPRSSDSAVIRNVTMQFRREPKNIDKLYLVDSDGDEIAELTKDTVDVNELTWKAQGVSVGNYIISSHGKVLGLKARIKDESRGYSEELIQVKSMSLDVSPIGTTTNSYQLIATNAAFPAHQTAYAVIRDVRNNRPPIIDIQEGDTMLLAEYAIEGAGTRVTQLTFTLTTQRGVTLGDFRMGAFHTTNTVGCSVEQNLYINCSSIPASIGAIEDSVIVQLWGSLELNENAFNPELQIDLLRPGKVSTSVQPGELGHILWTDSSGEFKWVEMEEPIAEGSVWK